MTKSSEFVDGTRVILKKNDTTYSVTMMGLKQENSGWYWCVKGPFQMPVHLTVTERPARKYITRKGINIGAISYPFTDNYDFVSTHRYSDICYPDACYYECNKCNPAFS